MNQHNPMNIRAVVFDVDGVLVNPPYRFAKYLERTHGLTMQHTREFFAGRFLECIVGRADLKIELTPFLSAWRINESVEAFVTRWFEIEREADAHLLAAVQALRQRGIRCYVGTNQERYRAAYLRKEMGFAHLFDGVFASAELGVAKPEALFFAKATEAIGMPPNEILFWDDYPKNVEAAREYGWHAELYTTFDTFAITMQSLLYKTD
jgi:putative hydrolase of the HAD superfamily